MTPIQQDWSFFYFHIDGQHRIIQDLAPPSYEKLARLADLEAIAAVAEPVAGFSWNNPDYWYPTF